MCELVIAWGSEGMSKAEIAFNLGISRNTLYRWINDHEEFGDAIKKAEDGAAAWFHRAFRKMAFESKDSNITALIFAAKNQLPDDFRDRKEHEVSGKLGVFEIDYTGYDDSDSDQPEEEDWE